tara:strand:+ start:1325 stop:1750 length:426 start_codon:yes stop_codon:yes gene_type:complete
MSRKRPELRFTRSDPLGDLLVRLRNASLAGHTDVKLPHSKLKLALAELLTDNGYLSSVETVDNSPQALLKLTLKYDAERSPAITGVKRVSKPGLRIYSKAGDIPRVMGGVGVSVVSTPQGLMTGSEAYRKKIGGEVLCFVW